jgi:hypothetical protein
MPLFSPAQWLLAIAAAFGMGISKAGFAGVGLFHVVVFALLFGARDSTGVVLPMLLVGDVDADGAPLALDARGQLVVRNAKPHVVIEGKRVRRISDAMYKPLIGWIILMLTVMQVVRMVRPESFGDAPHGRPFAWGTGLLAGGTTMLANAAIPVMSVYFLAVSLPKLEFVATTAWFFLIINLFKVPFSAWLG